MTFDLEEIRSRLTVSEVARRLGISVPSGRNDARCPRHGGESLRLKDDDGFFWCHGGCKDDGGKGDIFALHQFVTGSDFRAALEELAGWAGVEEQLSDAAKRQLERRRRAEDILAFAARFYHDQYDGSPAQTEARRRGLDVDDAQLGYAPDRWDALVSALRAADILLTDAEQAGVIKARRQGGGYYDLLRHRLIIPNWQRGRCVYLAGRTLGPGATVKPDEADKSKYKNVELAGVPLYHLNGTLSGRHTPIITESYTDVLRFAGAELHAAATGGEMKDYQAAQLQRFPLIYYAIHNDAAGERFADTLTRHLGEAVRIVPPGEHKDWDEALGAGKAWEPDDTLTWFRWKLRRIDRALDPVAQEQALAPLLDYLTALSDQARINVYLEELKKHFKWTAAVRNGYATTIRERRAQLREAELPQVAKPGETSDTWPYLVIENRMLYLSHDQDGDLKESVISDFVARIIAEQVSEDGAKQFTIAGTTAAGRAFQFDIDATAFAEERSLKAALTNAAGAGATVRARMTPHLGAAIQRLSQPQELQRMHRYTRTGWDAGGHFLIPGREPEATTIQLPRKLTYRVDPAADLEKGKEALEALVQAIGPEKATIALAFVFQASLAQLAGWRNERYGLFFAGRTGSLKSSWAQVLMCIYGPEFLRDELLIKWGPGATPGAIQALAAHAVDVPLLIDNYKPNTTGRDDFTKLIHNIVEGGEKDRLTRAAELKETKPVFCWPLITGEDVPDSDPASLARVLVLPFAWQRGQINEPLALAQQHAAHLSAIGRVWLEWLETDAGREVVDRAARRFAEVRRLWANKLMRRRPDMVNVLRVATNLATNALAWSVLMEHPALGEWATQYEEAQQAGLDVIASTMASYTAESLEANRYMVALRELLATGRCELLETTATSTLIDRDRVIGWRDDDLAYLLPGAAKQAVDRYLGPGALNNISEKALNSQLEGLGLIAARDKEHVSKVKWIAGAGKGQRVIWIKLSNLLGVPSEEAADATTTTTDSPAA